ncbi:MAG: Ig-like domain-containing protein [Christensenellaceae bacterium]|jgi:hypothetical protein
MKKGFFFFIVISLFLIMQVGAAFAAPTVDIEINATKKIDVALAAGATNIDVTTFEQDLRTLLSTKDPAVKEEDLFISATNSVSMNTDTSFQWWQYDHTAQTNPSNIDPANNLYIEQSAAQTSGHPYNNYPLHMVYGDAEKTILNFYGYGTSPYKDWLFLPSAERAIKTFEFDIEEQVAYDALDGVGFLFNTKITGSYTAGTQTMSGYLLFFQYDTGGVGSSMDIYKFTNVNTKTFHNVTTVGATISTTAGFTKIASSAVYSSTHKYRKFKVEVEPECIQVWYQGRTSAQGDFPAGTELTNANLVSFSLTIGGSSTKPTFAAPEAYGFGPLASYRSHGCAQPTHVQMKNLSMTMRRQRTLVDVVREPEWHANSNKFLVNLNTEGEIGVGTAGLAGELLNRLDKDDLYYIGWCSNTNLADSEELISQHGGKGALVNVNDSATSTYETQMQKIADIIYEKYYTPTTNDTVLVTDQVSLLVETDDFNPNDAVSEEFPEGRWSLIHTTDGYATNMGEHPLNGEYFKDIGALVFDKVGKYEIYLDDTLIKTIFAYREPVAEISVTYPPGTQPEVEDISSSPDGGTLTAEKTYLNLTDGDTTPQTGWPTTFTQNKIYLLMLEVTDERGYTRSTAKQVLYAGTGGGGAAVVPFASFTLSQNTVTKFDENQILEITNDSYDPAGAAVTSEYTFIKDGQEYTGFTVEDNKIDVSNARPGSYSVTLTVTSTNGTSSPVLQFFEIKAKETTLALSVEEDTYATDDIQLTVEMVGAEDLPEGKAEFFIDEVSLGEVAFTLVNGKYVATTNAWTAVPAGTYKIGVSYNYVDNDVYEVMDEEIEAYLVEKRTQPDFAFVLGEEIEKVLTEEPFVLNVTGQLSTGAIGYAIEDNSDGAISFVTGTRTVTLLQEGTAVIKATSPENAAYAAATATITINVAKDDSAVITFAEGDYYKKTYDGAALDMESYISVTGTTGTVSHSISYLKTGEVTPTTEKPVNAGTYTIMVTTTDNRYEEKTASKTLTIEKKELSAILLATPPAGANAMTDVTLTLALSGANELPPGTISFTANETSLGDPIAVTESSGTYSASILWEDVAEETYLITATYTPAENDNYTMKPARLSDYNVRKQMQPDFAFVEGAQDKVYEDEAFTVSLTGILSSGEITYEILGDENVIEVVQDNDSFEVSIIGIGDVSIVATSTADDSYNAAQAVIEISVVKKEIALSLTIEGWDYGAPAAEPALAGNTGGVTPLYTYEGRGETVYGPTIDVPTEIGTYTLKALVAESSYYEDGEAEAEFSIVPCACALGEVVFDGKTISIDYYKTFASLKMNAQMEVETCPYHDATLTYTYEIIDETTEAQSLLKSASADTGLITEDTLIVSTALLGKSVRVRVVVTQVETGKQVVEEAVFPVVQGEEKDTTLPPVKTSVVAGSGHYAATLPAHSGEIIRITLGGIELQEGLDYSIDEKGNLVLAEAVVERLSVGEHAAIVLYDNGDMQKVIFEITEAPAPSETPTPTVPGSVNTGDKNDMAVWSIVALLSLIALGALYQRKKHYMKR